MPILKLKPFCRDTIWGGQKLRDAYGLYSEGPNIAEAWTLSCHPDGPCIIENGTYAGKTLAEYITAVGRGVLGSSGLLFTEFPILIKLIDAQAALSIQVHPSDEYAMENMGQYGKTEMWYILDAEPGAFLYYGFSHQISKEEFAQRIADNTLTDVLHQQPVKKGECYFIPAGTLHAIGAGIVIAEIQQNSNITYRIYDYGRRGPDGKLRKLHVDQAKDVTQLCPAKTDYDFEKHLVKCPYFTVDVKTGAFSGIADSASFISFLIIEGNGVLQTAQEQMPISKGDSLFLPADSGDYRLSGSCTTICTSL